MGDENPQFDYAAEQARHRMQQIAREQEQEFVDYLIEESDETVQVDDFDIDALSIAQHVLHKNGYRNRDKSGEQVHMVAFAAPAAVNNARHSADTFSTIAGDPDRGAACAFSYASIEVYISPNLPDGTALLLHPHALTPNSLGGATHPKPYLVELPDGVVVISHDTEQ
jgi:hypothetical protein